MNDKPQASALWQKSDHPPLRLPRTEVKSGSSTQQQQPGSSTSTCTANNFKRTVFNPNAPEFVPRARNDRVFQPAPVESTPPRNTAQNRINRIRSSQEPQPQNDSSNEISSSSMCSEGKFIDIERIKHVISSLIDYPGHFDDLLMVFMESICPYSGDIITMSEITQLLVDKAINCPSFRYNGARLCWYVEQQCAEFRADLHLQCQKALQDHPNQQNVVLFIAELYTQLPHDSLYGALLIESFKKLLTTASEQDVKCVCQALKLTGYSLEENNRMALNELFSQLKSSKHNYTFGGSAVVLVNSVINLRESNWGRGRTGENQDYSECEQYYEEMVNGIVYETNGEALSREESEFLSYESFLMDNEDPDALCDPEPEMDEEIQASFKEFVKFSKG